MIFISIAKKFLIVMFSHRKTLKWPMDWIGWDAMEWNRSHGFGRSRGMEKSSRNH